MSNNPAGIIRAFAGSTIPDGYLLCDGSEISRSSYSVLFDAIGTTYGVGDGSTTFNIPDCRGRVIMGLDSGDAAFDALGETGGSKTANLQHSHTMNNHTHTASGMASSAASTSSQQSNDATTSFSRSGHTHTVTVNTGNQTNTGSDNQLSATQSILMPYMALNWMIKI